MLVDALRVSASAREMASAREIAWARIAVDSASFDACIDGAPRPSVFVIRERDLRSLLKVESVQRCVSSLRQQHEDKPLGYYFGGSKPVALESKYTEPGRLLSSLRNFLSSAPVSREPGVHFLGVASDVFDRLARKVKIDTKSPEEAFLGSSSEADEIRKRIRRAAIDPVWENEPVLIQGPPGAGKEIVARAIHDLGRGAKGGKWYWINCGALPGKLIESELFGIEPGTATGVDGRAGYWKLASDANGTLFLNEIGDLPHEQQVKLLRALSENQITPVGGRESIRVSARIIADTNRDLRAMVAKEAFREDLYSRLAKIMIKIPGVADRGRDLEELAQHFWRDWRKEHPDAVLSPEILAALRMHGMPGAGARELKSLLGTLAFEFKDELTPDVGQLHKAWRVRGDGPVLRSDTGLAAPVGAIASEPGSLESLREQVGLYLRQRGRYERFTEVLRMVLEELAERVAPLAIVHARTKTVASFAERVQRDRARFDEVRDLSGARLVVHTEDQIREARSLLERYFEIEVEGSRSSKRVSRATGLGYSAVRLVVRLDRLRSSALGAALGIVIPSEALDLWGEVEIQTVLEHAWVHVNREMGHDMQLPLPARWSDELSAAAEVLKAVDALFSRIKKGFTSYRTTYSLYLKPEQIQREMEILSRVLACESDAGVAVRLGNLAIRADDWDRAIAVLEPHAIRGVQPALRDLGVAICQKHKSEPESAAYASGQQYLERACAEPHRDPDAWASLAGTWKRRGRYDKSRECCSHALALDPADPYALGGLLEARLVLEPEVDSVAELTPAIERAVERCHEHVEAGVNLPWALYDLGRFLLLLGERSEGLIATARAVEHSTANFMITTSLQSLERLAERSRGWEGVDEARAILALGCAVRFPSPAAQQQLEALFPDRKRLSAPVVFVVEDSDTSARAVVDEALRDFRGAVITGDLLQAWADVVLSGLRPSEVLLVTTASDAQSQLEQHIAIALGARVLHSTPPNAAQIRALLGADS